MEIDNARKACQIVKTRIDELMDLDVKDYKQARLNNRAIESERLNFNFQRELLFKLCVEQDIANARTSFFRNAIALGEDPTSLLQYMPVAPPKDEFPSLKNLDAHLKYWQSANEKLRVQYL